MRFNHQKTLLDFLSYESLDAAPLNPIPFITKLSTPLISNTPPVYDGAYIRGICCEGVGRGTTMGRGFET